MDERLIKLRLDHLAKIYDTETGEFEVVHDVSLEVKENEFLVILGPGRCGKSVLLNMIMGLEAPTSGEVYLDGEKITGGSESLGMTFQRTGMMPWKTVMQNVELGPKFKHEDKATRRERAQKFIDLVGLHGFEKSYPKQLSGGMKQRVGIARAYCNNPDVLLMDEPFGALDAQTRYAMEDELLRIWEKEKRTIIFVTNNIEEAAYLGDRIVLLSECPAKVKEVYDINLPRPRNNVDPAFLKIRQVIAANTDLAL